MDSKTIIFPYHKNKNYRVIYSMITNHNSMLIQMYIDNNTEEEMSQALLNEEFPCIICFDSLSSKNTQKYQQ